MNNSETGGIKKIIVDTGDFFLKRNKKSFQKKITFEKKNFNLF